MKIQSKILPVLALASLLASCSYELEKQDYIQWVTDYSHGLHVRKQNGDFVFDVQFAPEDYLKLQNINRATAEDLQFYYLTISPAEGTADFIDSQSRDDRERQYHLYYYSYLFQQDIMLEENGLRYPCALYHFERSADFKKSRTFVIAFEKSNASSTSSARLVINSTRLGSLPVNITISKENIPGLQYDKNI